MRIGMIGLGRMGGNMSRRLLRAGHEVVAYDRDPAAVARLVEQGALGSATYPTWSAASTPRAWYG